MGTLGCINDMMRRDKENLLKKSCFYVHQNGCHFIFCIFVVVGR